MARLDELVAQVADQSLRQQMESALADMKRRQRFGLVFEEHIPEMTVLHGLPIRTGLLVQRRDDPHANTFYRVRETTPQGQATVEPSDGGEPEQVPVGDLLAVKRFGEPMYPAFTPIGSVRRGEDNKPHHAVVNGENFHALQLLIYQFEGQVDCIYLDPPYNTGASDWKYNNRYVDKADTWRHSKWLSMMEKRLRLAKRLLKADGVLIVTIDENENNHLGMLLEKLFPEYLRYMVTIVMNPKGTYKQNFGSVEEYAYFCCPPGEEVIVGRPALSAQETLSDLDVEIEDDPDYPDAPDLGKDTERDYDDLYLRRRGQGSSFRSQRPNQFYAIHVDEEQHKVVGVGPLLKEDDPWAVSEEGNVITVYPVDAEGNERTWRYVRESMMTYIEQGAIVVGRKTANGYALNHRKPKNPVKRLKTVWWDKAHDAGVHGTNVVTKLLGKSGLFPFPKSVYAVRDCLAAVCRDRTDALIVDLFAGSGTTLHSTALLNTEDDGKRRCVLVTNNEVDNDAAAKLHRNGLYRGEPEFEARGIFEQVTRPRIKAAITGNRADGSEIDGNHRGGRPFAQGFPENVEFYRLDYLDPDEVDLGLQFEAILPALWMAAGGVGDREKPEEGQDYSMPVGSTYGVLFKESRFRRFKEALEERPEVTHVWLVTDSEEAYAEMRSALPPRLSVSMLYRDYLRNFKINTERNL